MKKHLAFIGLVLIITSCSGKKDFERVNFLKTDGIVINRDRVIAYFPKDSIPENRMNEIVDTLNLGIMLANKFIGGPIDWQVFKDKKLTYYFSPGYFVSHTSESGEIFIPYWRVKESQSPWLHETMHILLRSEKGHWNPKSNPMNYFKMPMWFTEGMAEYLAMRISYDNQLPKVDLFDSGGYITVDSVCRSNLKKENGPYILKHVGETGIIAKLFGKKRGEYAPTFYNSSCSFTKYLVETYGLDKMLKAVSDYKNEHKTIERLTGKTMKELKKEWLIKIKLD
jgi:hypothetical protein